MQLGNHNTFCSVDDECATRSHVRYHAQIYIGNLCLKILVVHIVAREFHLGFQWHAVSEAAFEALIHGIARGVDVIVQKFEDETVSRIRNWKVFREDLVEPFLAAVLSRRVNLEKLLEGFQLYVKEIRVINGVGLREAVSFVVFCCQGFNFLRLHKKWKYICRF